MKLLVTGTDTGVGKTAIASALLRAARRRGWSARGIKPVESGCRPVPGGLEALDAQTLARAAGHEPLCHARFEAPVSPAQAAVLAGQSVDLAELVAFAQTHVGAGLTLLEGAGGFLAPLTTESLWADLAEALRWPLLVVARDALGTINHTLLTLEAARARGLVIAGVVLSQAAPASAEEANAEQIRRCGNVPVWTVSHGNLEVRAELVGPILDALAAAD